MNEIEEKLKEIIAECYEEKVMINDLENRMKELQDSIKQKEGELKEISDKDSGFYKDLASEIEDENDEFLMIFAKRQSEKNKLEKEIESKRTEIIADLQEKKNIIDENRNEDIDAIKKEKEELERQIALNDTTKEEFINLNDEQKKEVRYAKEKYLINKRKLKELEPKIQLLELLEGDKPKDKFIEINSYIDVINNNFNYDNIENLYNNIYLEELENAQEISEQRNSIIKDMSFSEFKSWYTGNDEMQEKNEKTEEPVIKNEKSPDVKETKKTEKDVSKNTNKETTKQKDSFSDENVVKILPCMDIKVTKIHINENDKKLKITARNEYGKEKVIEWGNGDSDLNIEDILKNRKEIFKENRISSRCNAIAGSKIRQFFLERKLNPIVIAVASALEDEETIDKYIRTIYSGSEQYFSGVDFEIIHDLRESTLSLRNRILMSRFARAEKKSLGEDKVKVLKKENSLKLLGTKGKRKIKNIPKTLAKGQKYISKSLKDTVDKAGEKFKSLLRVDLKAMNNNEKISKETSKNEQSKDIDGNDLEI